MNDTRSLLDFIRIFIELINMILPVIMALTLLVFFRGLVSFIAKSGDSKSHSEGRNLMVWGLIGLFVMVSLFGILNFFFKDLGFTNPNNPGGVLPLLPQ
ncbi:MAG: hypothetical protein AAB758_01115 [Patescibacteria group bacterium]